MTQRGCQCRTLGLLFAGLGLAPVLFILVGSSRYLGTWTIFEPQTATCFGDQAPVQDPERQPAGGNITTILYYTKWFGNDLPAYTGLELKNITRTLPGGESVTCAFTSDKQEFDQAHAVVFHAPDIRLAEMPDARPSASQVWVYWSTESPLNDCTSDQCDPISLDPERMVQFDLRMGYQLWSDVVLTYISPWFKYDTDRPRSRSWQERRNAVVWIANNCESHNKREKYLEAFMKHYPVHSYGLCLNNMPGLERMSDEELMELMSQYKFAFAWENANCEDYATEKLSHVFQAGGLPIVDGPDDYSAFVPNNHSVIHVSDFAGPKALADHLRRLENDQALYESYFTYKPPTSHYGRAFLAFDLDWDIAGKLCRKVAQHRIEASQDRAGEPQVGRRRVVHPDLSCKLGRWDREYYDDGTMSEPRLCRTL